ncbi:hypothetical protein [Photobacterium galatheae]|nr:hypothetical protein [Photobacterium galatheae]
MTEENGMIERSGMTEGSGYTLAKFLALSGGQETGQWWDKLPQF